MTNEKAAALARTLIRAVWIKEPDDQLALDVKVVEPQLRPLFEALEWIAKGYQYGMPECKTVGHIPPRPEGQHCPSCWLYHAQGIAINALDKVKLGTRER